MRKKNEREGGMSYDSTFICMCMSFITINMENWLIPFFPCSTPEFSVGRTHTCFDHFCIQCFTYSRCLVYTVVNKISCKHNWVLLWFVSQDSQNANNNISLIPPKALKKHLVGWVKLSQRICWVFSLSPDQKFLYLTKPKPLSMRVIFTSVKLNWPGGDHSWFEKPLPKIKHI